MSIQGKDVTLMVGGQVVEGINSKDLTIESPDWERLSKPKNYLTLEREVGGNIVKLELEITKDQYNKLEAFRCLE